MTNKWINDTEAKPTAVVKALPEEKQVSQKNAYLLSIIEEEVVFS